MSVDAADRTRPEPRPDVAQRVNVWAAPAFWWRVAIVLVVLWGLVAGERRLAYFTTQSNVIVFAYFAGTLYWMLRRGTAAAPAPVLRGGVTTWILTTMVVSHVLLNHFENPIPGLVVADPTDQLANRAIFAMHYVVPVMVLVDWVAFGPHRVVRWRDAAWWLLYPAAYGLVFLWRALALPEVPDRFPYPFLDTDALGALGSLLEMLRVVAYIAVLGLVVMALDRLSWWVGVRLGRVRHGQGPGASA